MRRTRNRRLAMVITAVTSILSLPAWELLRCASRNRVGHAEVAQEGNVVSFASPVRRLHAGRIDRERIALIERDVKRVVAQPRSAWVRMTTSAAGAAAPARAPTLRCRPAITAAGSGRPSSGGRAGSRFRRRAPQLAGAREHRVCRGRRGVRPPHAVEILDGSGSERVRADRGSYAGDVGEAQVSVPPGRNVAQQQSSAIARTLVAWVSAWTSSAGRLCRRRAPDVGNRRIAARQRARSESTSMAARRRPESSSWGPRPRNAAVTIGGIGSGTGGCQ